MNNGDDDNIPSPSVKPLLLFHWMPEQVRHDAVGNSPYTGRMSSIKSAASVILVRGPDEEPEVYLVRRAPELKFFGGYWVFPGGNVSPVDYHGEDDPEELVLKRCAVREIPGGNGYPVRYPGRGVQPGAKTGVEGADQGSA